MITLINDSYFNYGQRESFQVFFDLMAVIFGSERKEETVNQFDLLFLKLYIQLDETENLADFVAIYVLIFSSCSLPKPFVSSYISSKVNPAFNCPPICSVIL